MPWPLTRTEMDSFCQAGLVELGFEDYIDEETPPVRRFRATYARPTARQHRLQALPAERRQVHSSRSAQRLLKRETLDLRLPGT